MYYKLVNRFDVKELQKECVDVELPELSVMSEKRRSAYALLIASVGECVETIVENYGDERKADSDLGGYVYLFPSAEDYRKHIDSVKEFHHITEQLPEYEDVISEAEGIEMVQELFLVSDDFAVILGYPR